MGGKASGRQTHAGILPLQRQGVDDVTQERGAQRGGGVGRGSAHAGRLPQAEIAEDWRGVAPAPPQAAGSPGHAPGQTGHQAWWAAAPAPVRSLHHISSQCQASDEPLVSCWHRCEPAGIDFVWRASGKRVKWCASMNLKYC